MWRQKSPCHSIINFSLSHDGFIIINNIIRGSNVPLLVQSFLHINQHHGQELAPIMFALGPRINQNLEDRVLCSRNSLGFADLTVLA